MIFLLFLIFYFLVDYPMILDNLSTKYFKFKYNESEDQETNSILLLNFINKCLESAKNIDILIFSTNI